MVEPVGYIAVSLFLGGMAASFLAADLRSPTSRCLSLLFFLMSLQLLMNLPASAGGASVVLWNRAYSLLDAVTIICGLEWILRLGRTTTSPDARRERVLRLAQALAALNGLEGLAWPELRGEVFATTFRVGFLSRPAFYLFAIPYNLAFGLGAVALVGLLKAELDAAEKVRLFGALLAAPFWVSGISVPLEWKPIPAAMGGAIFLVAAIRYHVLQGQRGQFLSRFLSPELARLVRERGLASMTQKNRVELSVVACDLRGFTAFAETAAPEEVMKLLEEYYGAVGEVVAEHGGSIKDFAGDGILCLVGAPLACGNHAERAVAMALAIRDHGERVLERWRKLGLDLGLGVGVASGFATVGTLGGAGRLEYAAVGPAVNLAARLSSRALDGQVLADARVAGLAAAPDRRFERLETTEVKGFARPVTVFEVDAEGTARAEGSR